MPNRGYSLSFKCKVLEYLKTHSGEATARHFKIMMMADDSYALDAIEVIRIDEEDDSEPESVVLDEEIVLGDWDKDAAVWDALVHSLV